MNPKEKQRSLQPKPEIRNDAIIQSRILRKPLNVTEKYITWVLTK